MLTQVTLGVGVLRIACCAKKKVAFALLLGDENRGKLLQASIRCPDVRLRCASTRRGGATKDGLQRRPAGFTEIG